MFNDGVSHTAFLLSFMRDWERESEMCNHVLLLLKDTVFEQD